MRKKYVKSAVVGLLAGALVGSNAYAGVSQSDSDVKFTKKFIDDSYYTTITSGTKIVENSQLRVKVTEIYDEDGNVKENWNKTIWKVYKSGSRFSDDTPVTKGTTKKIELDQKVTSSTKLTVKCHGNTEDLDALISGYVYNFYKS